MASYPETDLARVRRWVAARNDEMPFDARDQVRIELDEEPRSVTIMECRPPFSEEYGPEWTRFPIARLRYTNARRVWELFWRDRNLKFHLYEDAKPTGNVETLLEEIKQDRICIFWG